MRRIGGGASPAKADSTYLVSSLTSSPYVSLAGDIQMTCMYCGVSQCLACHSHVNPGISCVLNRRERRAGQLDNDEATDTFIKQTTKPCQCGRRVQKMDDSCDHVTCPACGSEFCWECLADHHIIMREGNHRHDRTCRHYA